MALVDRVVSMWNAFRNLPVDQQSGLTFGGTASYGNVPPSRSRVNIANERSIVTSLLTHMSKDVAGLEMRHVKLDDDGRYSETIEDGLNDCLTLEANLDQGARAFRQDIAMTMFERGVAAIVPTDTSRNPMTNEIFDVYTMRVGEIVAWYPRHVRVSVYNEATGNREEITLEKRFVAIVENPMFAVMNEANSTLQRLIYKLSLLDTMDEQLASGKLDIIIQLPYVIRSEEKRQAADQRRKDIEFQLKGSQYGIAYADGTEKITQLNRPAENNLYKQIEGLIAMLYTQLGITAEIMNGTAEEAAMTNYFNRTIDPVLDAITEALQRAFLGNKMKTNRERVMYFRDSFAFASLTSIAEAADKLGRNKVITPNEVRGFIGLRPSTDPTADELANNNMPVDKQLTADPQKALPSRKKELTEVAGQ